MRNLNTLHRTLPLPMRYALAAAMFVIALLLRFWILPVESGLAYLTFYPAMVVTFYLCGVGPGVLMVAISAATGYYIFSPPFWSFAHGFGGDVAASIFLVSAFLTGLVVRQLQTYAEQSRIATIALQQSEQRYRNVLEDQTEVICRCKADGTILYVNDAYCRFFGKSREALTGNRWHPVAWHEDVAHINEKLNELSPANPTVTIENRVVPTGGALRWVQFVNRAVFDGQGRLIEIQAIGRDITEAKVAQSQLRELMLEQQLMLDNQLVGIAKLRDRHIIWKNPGMNRIFGYDADELLGKSTRIFYPDEASCEATGAAAYPILKGQGIFRTQLQMLRKDGERIWVDISGGLLSEQNNESMWMLIDITSTRKQQEQIEHLAHHDFLTGLPNRLLLAERLRQASAQAERTQRMLAVCYLDLDGFKPVNDEFGHAAGDRLLKEVAHRMQASIRAHDSVFRLGGDEFVLLLTNLENIEEYQSVLQRVVAEISKPFVLDETHEVAVTASIGVTLFPLDNSEPDTLLHHADGSMYQAKKLGRNQVFLYRPYVAAAKAA